MASLAKSYSKKVRKELRYFPVWPPGEAVQPGDVGILKDNVFYREASLDQIFPSREFPSLDLGLSETENDSVLKFCSDKNLESQASASLSTLDKLVASVRLTFSKKGEVLFHAVGLTISRLRDLNGVRQTISNSKNRARLPKGFIMVSQVESAKRYAVLLSESGGWSVEGSGSSDALQNLCIADASIGMTNISGAGYKNVGSGPVVLRLYGFYLLDKLLQRPPQLLSVDAPISEDSDLREVLPNDSSLDGLGEEEGDEL